MWKKTISAVLSSAKAKYQALIEGTKEVFWSRKLLSEIKHIKPGPTLMFCDNISNIKSLVFHARTKHTKCHYHFVQEKGIYREIDILHVLST
jgi:hypothetical protein